MKEPFVDLEVTGDDIEDAQCLFRVFKAYEERNRLGVSVELMDDESPPWVFVEGDFDFAEIIAEFRRRQDGYYNG